MQYILNKKFRFCQVFQLWFSPPEVIQKFRDRISALEKDIEAVMQMEAEEKALRISELQVNKAEKMITHQDEILGRPKRTWFQTHKEREHEKGGCDFFELSIPWLGVRLQ